MNAPLTSVHSRFGGSVAARVLCCPASVGLVAKVPEHLRRPSAYAERGTACHAAMVPLIDETEDLESLVGKTFSGYTITQDDAENALRPAYAYIEPLLDAPGAEFYLERRVLFPTVAGAFGTVDLLIRIGSTVHVIDFKFGTGCASTRFIQTATKMCSTRSLCSTPWPRATHSRNSSPPSTRSS
jgi:hypothetical protein